MSLAPYTVMLRDPIWDSYCRDCALKPFLLRCNDCIRRLNNTERIWKRIKEGRPQQGYQFLISLAARPAHRLLHINSSYLFALTFYKPGSQLALCRLVRAMSICVLDWLKMVGWLDRTPCLIAQIITCFVVKTQNLGAHNEVYFPLSRKATAIDWRTAVRLVDEEFDRTWRAMKESVAAHNVPIAQRVSKRRRN